jgi:hypothetical protein
MRWLFDAWHLAGLRVAVDVDGTPGERQRIDRGWSVRLALPWAGLTHLLDEPGLPQEGAQLRLALARNQVVDQRRSQHTAVWSWHVAGDHGLHAPETYPVIELTARS